MVVKSKNIAFYLRLSYEKYKKYEAETESDSISNQRDLLTNFIKGKVEFTSCMVTEFCDDGYTGTNMNRPGFQKLINMIMDNKIDTIIIKDFSRLGRNFLQVGKYTEEIFPALGVRVISVNDRYDSNSIEREENDFSIQFKNLVNDYQVKSLSKSVKSAIIMRQKQGAFISPNPIFGYQKSEQDKHKLIIDKETSNIVSRLFDLALEGQNATEIAKQLNRENVHTPGWYVNRRGKRKYFQDERTGWTSAKVYKILRDRRYVGDMIGNVRCRKRIASKETVRIDKQDWLLVKGTHQGIVTEEEFDLINSELLPEKNRKNISIGKQRRKGFCICPYCGRKLRKSNVEINPYYSCVSDNYSEKTKCSEVKIRESEILETVTTILEEYIALLIDKEKILREAKKRNSSKKTEKIDRIQLEKMIEKLMREKIILHEKYRSEEITKEDFLYKKKAINENIERLKEEQKQTDEYGESEEKLEKEIRKIIETYEKGGVKNFEDLEEWVEKIYVYENKKLVVNFVFSDVYRKM